MSQQNADGQPQEQSGWSKTKSGFSTVGKGAGAARTGINSGLSKLDSMSISTKGVSFKKNLSAGNVLYDRENHVIRPKQDVSHFAPPPRRIPGQAPPAAKAVPARPAAPVSASRTTPAIPALSRNSGRAVPTPPPVAQRTSSATEEPLPVYTPVSSATTTSSGVMGDLSSRLGQMRASPAPIAPKPATASKSSIPSMNEANTAFNSAKTVGGLYGKYGNQQPGQKTATPSWSEVKAGAAAAQNLHSFHGKYAPKDSTTAVQPIQQTLPAPKPFKPVLGTSDTRGPAPTPAPKASPIPPPLPRGKPTKPKEYCLGLFSFDAQAPGDLTFAVGDKIEVLERTNDADAWWKGRLNGQEGIFPGNYCRLETS